MTYSEIYQDLCNQTKDVKITKPKGIFNIGSLCLLLSSLQVSDLTMEQIQWAENQKDFALLFEDYHPRALLKHGQYLAQLNRVLDHFKPQNPSPYKKFTQAVFLTAKFLSHYDSLEDFRKEVYLACVDEEMTLKYLQDFRRLSNLSSMYFVKTCMFFAKAGFLDIPLPTKKAKEYLLPLLDIDDENEKVYRKMLAIVKNNHISCYELNERIEALSC